MILAHMEKSIKAQFFRTSKLGMNSTIGLRLMIVGIFCCFILPLQWTQRFQYNKLFISKAPLAAVPPFLLLCYTEALVVDVVLLLFSKQRWR